MKSEREKLDKYEKYPVDLGLTGGSDYPYTAYIDFVNNQIDPTTGTLQVRGVIANPKPSTGPRVFVPGMFLRVRLPIGDAHPALLIPQAAIGTDQSQKYVMVANADNVVEYRPINVGEVQSDTLQIAIPEQIIRGRQRHSRRQTGRKGRRAQPDGQRSNYCRRPAENSPRYESGNSNGSPAITFI